LDEGQQSTKEGRPCLWAKLAEMAGKHSSEAFNARDDPLEAAVFSVLVEMMMEMDKADNENQIDITSLLDLDLFLN